LGNPRFHFLIRNQSARLNVALCFLKIVEQDDFVRHVAKINVVVQALNRLKNLILHSHIQSL
jgi:hypothetical protein